MKQFFLQLWQSISDRAAYPKLLDITPMQAIRYVLWAAFLGYLPLAAYMSVYAWVELRVVAHTALDELATGVPAGWMVRWDGTKLAWTPDQDITLSYPSSIPQDQRPAPNFALLTTNSDKLTASGSAEALIVFTATEAAVRSTGQLIPYDGFEAQLVPHLELTASSAPQLSATLKAQLEDNSTLLQLGMAGAFFVGLVISKLLVLVSEGIFVMIIARIFWGPVQLSRVWALVCRAYVLVMLLEYPFLYTDGVLPHTALNLALWVFVLLGRGGLGEEKSES